MTSNQTTSETTIGQGLVEAVGLAAEAKERARRGVNPTVGEFMVGNPSKRTARFLVGLDGEHAAWRTRQGGGSDQG